MEIDLAKSLVQVPIDKIILLVLALGGLIAVIDFVGLLPPKMAKWLARNRLETTLQALRKIGVRVCWDEEQQTITIIQRALDAVHVQQPAYKIRLHQLLAEETFGGEFHIGATRAFSSEGFVDVMGGSTDKSRVEEYARILNTHASVEALRSFDIVATPKTGSPILGYAFASLVGRPCVLGGGDKAQNAEEYLGPHARLDFPKSGELKGRQALLVDDSSTGGRKLLSLAEDLRKGGAVVSDALVLFEPQGKGARELLDRSGIKLHAVVDGPKGRF